jgi:uncharacterized protein (DUF58 family)
MAALAVSGERKVDIAITAAGVIGYLAARHGDLVGMVAGDEQRTSYRAPESTEAHLERMLHLVHSATRHDSARSDLTTQLEFVAKSFRRRMILVVIADDRELRDREFALLRRLGVQHEILWLTIGDADPTRGDWAASPLHDIADAAAIPSHLRASPRLRRAFAAEQNRRLARAEDVLDALSISSRRVVGEADVIPSLFRLLEVHRHARR